MIRDFARHIVSIRALSGSRRVTLEKTDKHTWRAAPVRGALTVVCEIYAWDLSVRGAHLDASHGFFNGASVFLRVIGREDRACELEILPPRGDRYRGWRVATAMARAGARPFGFGAYAAADYDELIDHPVELGRFTLAAFRTRSVPHQVAITGEHRADLARLCRDLKQMCERQIDLFGAPAPMARYLFLVTAVGEGYGGLEHRASCALLCSRGMLPQRGSAGYGESYRRFLGLASHEYFHTWNVKRIKPAVFVPCDLDREIHTTLLWAFEGLTSYYDDLMLVRAGLITVGQYLELLGRNITSHLRTPGRARQSVVESSFDAWTRHYRQDENSPNALVSYYLKGSLVGLCLDLLIRSGTRGRRSLDDVMRALWRRYGRTGRGVGEGDIESLAQEISGLDLRRFFRLALRSTAELPIARVLATHGVAMTLRAAESARDAGGKPAVDAGRLRSKPGIGVVTRTEGRELVLKHVLEGGAAQRAGMSAGDVIVAIDGIRCPADALDSLFDRRRPGERLRVHAFRRDELRRFDVLLARAPADTCVLAAPKRSALFARWLGAPGR